MCCRIVIEFDTRRVLDPSKGSLFGAIAETTPLPRRRFRRSRASALRLGRQPGTDQHASQQSHLAGRRTCATCGISRTPFAIAEELRPLFRKRLIDSLTDWDMRDGKRDWTPAALTASAKVFLDDFLLFDVSKPITDTSYLEIEKSTLNGHAYQTGGGRTVDAQRHRHLDDLDGESRPRISCKAGQRVRPSQAARRFPYLASPNTQLQTVADSVDLLRAPDQVWALIGQFGGTWHPLIAKIKVTGTVSDNCARSKRSTASRSSNVSKPSTVPRDSIATGMISGIPAADYSGR